MSIKYGLSRPIFQSILPKPTIKIKHFFEMPKTGHKIDFAAQGDKMPICLHIACIDGRVMKFSWKSYACFIF